MGNRIVVFGSALMDLTGRVNSFPVPGQTVLGNCFAMGVGGKGSNQAIAASRAGGNVVLVTKIGTDTLANEAMRFYRQEGMCTDYIFCDEKYATGVALILVDELSAQNEIAVFSGACAHITLEDIERCAEVIESASILLLQHEINFDAQNCIIEKASKSGVKTILNPAPAVLIPDEILEKIDVIIPNETETQMLTGVEVDTYDSAKKAAEILLKKKIKSVVITMGDKGVYATDGKKEEFLPSVPVKAIDTTGAGDAFIGAFVTALSEEKTIFEALCYGNAAGALAVKKRGTSVAMPDRSEIDKIVKDYYMRI